MANSGSKEPEKYTAQVDQQDGGPGAQTEDNSGGETNDVASGGVSHEENEQGIAGRGPTTEPSA